MSRANPPRELNSSLTIPVEKTKLESIYLMKRKALSLKSINTIYFFIFK